MIGKIVRYGGMKTDVGKIVSEKENKFYIQTINADFMFVLHSEITSGEIDDYEIWNENQSVNRKQHEIRSY